MSEDAIEISAINTEDRICWICLSSDSEASGNNAWRRPCHCRGSLKWAHQGCLQRWISELQRDRTESNHLSCHICGTHYQIVYPPSGLLYNVLQSIDQTTRSLSFVFTGGMVLGSIYWSALTYGAITVMQVYGHEKGLRTMQLTDPPLLFFGLPAIPLCLLLATKVPWESGLLFIWRNYIRPLPVFQIFCNKETATWQVDPTVIDSNAGGFDTTRFICNALVLPTISTILGRRLYNNVRSDEYRAFFGAFTYLGLKGLLTAYYREMRYRRVCRRRIKDYED